MSQYLLHQIEIYAYLSFFSYKIILEIVTDKSIGLHEFNGSPIYLDEGYYNTGTWTVWLYDDLLPHQSCFEIINIKSYMGNFYNQFWIRCIIPIPLPLNSEWVVLVIANGKFKVGQINFAIKSFRCRDSNMVIFHICIPFIENDP